MKVKICTVWSAPENGQPQKFDKEYVERLADGVWQYMGEPLYVFYVGTIPFATGKKIKFIPVNTNLRGWWVKLCLFGHTELQDCKVVFFDLDTVIKGYDAVKLTTYSGAFMALRDFYRINGVGSGLMVWQHNLMRHIWENFKANPNMNPQLGTWGDQAFIQSIVGDCDRVQDVFPGVVSSFKVGFDPNADIVCFHGSPMPHEVNWLEEKK